MHFSLASDLVWGDLTEDGERTTREVFYVVATDERGRRWRSMNLSADWTDSFRFCKERTRRMGETAMLWKCDFNALQVMLIGGLCEKHGILAYANMLQSAARKVFASVDVPNNAEWQPTYPVYGSVEYEMQEPELVARERADDEFYNR